MSIWDYRHNFAAYDEPLDPGDPRHVVLNDARGDYNGRRLLRALGIDPASRTLRDPPVAKCILYGGHRGCGKSTELRALAAELRGSERFHVIQVDALVALDINNLNYADVALALTEALVVSIGQAGIKVPQVYLTPLQDWSRLVSHQISRSSSVDGALETGGEVKTGLPLVGSLFARLTTAIRSNSTWKTEIREQVRNSFSDLARSFNQLQSFVEGELRTQGMSRAMIFVVDGTDRLRRDEAEAFFIRDIHQLRQLRANSIYCAPITLLDEQGAVYQNFDAVERLPMLKLADKGGTRQNVIAWQRLREFVHKRLPAENFDDESTLDRLIAHSGGHPRDLLRLVNLCLLEIDEGPITRAVADTAARHLSDEYRRYVRPEDYALLAAIDREPPTHTPASDQTRRLLYNLILLEYNSYWWQTHPAVQALDGYRSAAAGSSGANGNFAG